MKRLFLLILSISVLLTLSGCAKGIKPISNGKLNGSVSTQKRTPVVDSGFSNFSEVAVQPARTNIIQVNIIEDGKVLTTIPVQVVTPAQNKYVQIDSTIKKEQKKFNWFLFIRYSGIIIGILLVLLYAVGFKKIKEFIVSPFKKNRNFD